MRGRIDFWKWGQTLSLRAAAALVLLAAVLAVFKVPAAAEETVWRERRGRLLLNYCDSADGREPVAGAEFTLYRIGVPEEKMKEDMLSASFRPLVRGRDGGWINVSAATEASAIEGEVRTAYGRGIPEGGKIYTGSTGSDGTLLFDNLEPGAYLVSETRPAKKHRASAPFLFSVPFTAETEVKGMRRGGVWSWEGTAEPKPQPCGDLVISKEVRGNAAELEREFHFRIVLKSEGIFHFQKSDGSRGAIRSGDTAALSGGQTLTIEDIPVGTEYEVTEVEADREGYSTESTGTAGRIRRKVEARAAFINKKYEDRKAPGEGRGTTSPVRTGDASHIGAWLALLLVSALPAGGLIRRGRRGKEGHR